MLNPFKIISKIIRSDNQKTLDKLQSIVKKVNDFESEISNLNDEEFLKNNSTKK